MIDYALVKPSFTRRDVAEGCRVVLENGIGALCVLPPFVEDAVRGLAGGGAKVCAAVAFPFGAHPTEAKVREVEYVLERGAEEVDFVVNIPLVKSGDYEAVEEDVRRVVRAARRYGDIVVKSIIETGYLTAEEIVSVSRIADEAGVDYVKTCTGFGPRGASLEDVKLIRKAVRRAGVKAAGGISSFEKALAFIEAGASRIGTSHPLEILRGCSST